MTYGTAGREEARVAVGGPLIEGLLGGGVGYAFSRNDGTWENALPGVSDRYAEVGGRESRNLSASISFTPTEALDIELSYVKGEREAEFAGSWNVAANDPQDRLNCGPTVLVLGMANSPRYICGELSPNLLTYASPTSTHPAGILQTETPATEAEMDLLTARIGSMITAGLVFN